MRWYKLGENIKVQLAPISGLQNFLKKFMKSYFMDANKDLSLQRDLKTLMYFGTPLFCFISIIIVLTLWN